MVLVNVGCGTMFHPAWKNFDIDPVSPHVSKLDLRRGLPLADSVTDACYCSHVLEHLSPEDAHGLLMEMRRILVPGGVVRIVVPDLEGIARAYLAELEAVERGDVLAAMRLEWMTIELLDQMSRRKCGGEMAGFIRSCPQGLRPFIVSRIGREAESFWAADGANGLLGRFRGKGCAWFLDNLRYLAILSVAALIGGRKGRQVVHDGWFLGRGETHRWMYDRHSIRCTLEKARFTGVRICRADDSMIPNFNEYSLDMCGDQVRKPDSLFAEAVKAKPT